MTKTKDTDMEAVADAGTMAAARRNKTSGANETSKNASRPAFLAQYIKAYPGEKVFYVTSDRQVFLGKDYNLAKFHQNSLGKGELKSYTI